MAEDDIVGKIQTVLGPISPERLGVTMTYEHILVDLSSVFEPPESASARGSYNGPLTSKTLGEIQHYGARHADDSRLFDVPTAIDEVNLYKQHGGSSLVDVTSIDIARDPVGLARISRATGVNIIMGGSHYVAVTHPAGMDSRGEEEIVERIVGDVTQGVDGTPIRSGVIGEIGCSWPLDDNERKVLRASAKAQRLTEAPILIHPGRDETAPLEIIEVLAETGADLGHTIMGHLDRTVFLRDTLKRIAEAGCCLEWDLFGQEAAYYAANPKIDMPSDARRMDDIAWISAQGYGRRVLVGHDIALKHHLARYGGHGYSYILAHVVPRMFARGFAQEAIDHILVENPRSVLAFSAPQA